MKPAACVDMVINPDADISQLIAAVILRAKREAARGDREARQWLITEGAIWADAIMEIHPERFTRWARGHRLKRPARRTDPRRWDKYKKTAQEAPGRAQMNRPISQNP